MHFRKNKFCNVQSKWHQVTSEQIISALFFCSVPIGLESQVIMWSLDANQERPYINKYQTADCRQRSELKIKLAAKIVDATA